MLLVGGLIVMETLVGTVMVVMIVIWLVEGVLVDVVVWVVIEVEPVVGLVVAVVVLDGSEVSLVDPVEDDGADVVGAAGGLVVVTRLGARVVVDSGSGSRVTKVR